jgi:L-ascorbate metabolism protein UlaG (beta-lactamase superfamily)
MFPTQPGIALLLVSPAIAPRGWFYPMRATAGLGLRSAYDRAVEHEPEPTTGSVRWIGHSTVLITVDGVRLLTDPLLRAFVAHLRRRVPVHPDALMPVDAVLLSHAHHDHLDLRSLDRVGRSTPILMPRGLAPLLRKRGFTDLHELEVGQTQRVGSIEVEATFAAHDGARPPYPAKADAVGYAVRGSRRVYFAGDTDLFDEMEGLVPDLDVALIPIWGWGPSLGRGDHLDPGRAAQALALLRPRIAIPIHWGTYAPLHHGVASPPPFLRNPRTAFVRAAAEEAPEVDVRVLAPGEALTF